jgi:hypothetical protein
MSDNFETTEHQDFETFISEEFEQILASLQKNEPYNLRGVYFIEIRDFIWFNVVNTDEIREKYLVKLTREQFHWYLDCIATRLFKTRDLFYMSEDMTLLSTIQFKGFLKFSEKIKQNFKGYQLKEDLTFEA